MVTLALKARQFPEHAPHHSSWTRDRAVPGLFAAEMGTRRAQRLSLLRGNISARLLGGTDGSLCGHSVQAFTWANCQSGCCQSRAAISGV